MITYKGTDKDMKCYGGMQYAIGEKKTDDGALRCGEKGFHSCGVPMDVLTYYKPDGSRFFECAASGKIDKTGADDSKIASSEVELKAEIGLVGLIKAQIEYIKKSTVKQIAQGYQGHAAAQGDGGHAAAQGYRGHAAAQGDWGHAAAQGYRGHAAAQGYQGRAEVHGKNSISAAFGIGGCALAGELGDWIVLSEWFFDESGWHIKEVRSAKIDGEILKPNVWYKLVNGEFIETELE